jgi:Tfp pilus assembly protein PilF
MGKDIWAKRKLETIFRMNPYHYESLILLAEIKMREKRFDEAKNALEKAINAIPERPESYAALGELHLGRYRATDDADELSDAFREFQNALSKHNEHVASNRYLGILSLLKGDYQAAAKHFAIAREAVPENAPTHYNCAIARDKSGDVEAAHADFSKAMKRFPDDNFISAGFEDFLIAREYKMGHPSRVRRGDAQFEKAIRAQKLNLADVALFHSRKAVLLNPLKREARTFLKDYYYAQDFYRFYLDELKDLERIFPEEGYQEKLNIAVIKRRERLYHRAGYAQEEPPRHVPVVLVLDFIPRNVVPAYFDAGRVMANQLTFALGQFGRMRAMHMRDREALLGPILFDDDDPEAAQAQRKSVVQPAQRSPSAQAKALLKRTKDGWPVHSFQTLLKDLATICRNRI